MQKVERSADKRSSKRGGFRLFLPALPPIILLVLYYISCGNKAIMNWVSRNIALPYRAAAGKISSLGPLKYFSIYEVLLTLLILWALFVTVRAIIAAVKSRRISVIARRMFSILIVALYIGAIFSWLWDSGYHSTNLAEKTGLNTVATVSQLKSAAKLFAAKANELSAQVDRDENRHFKADKEYYFTASKEVFGNIQEEFSSLQGESFSPKPMIYSKFMSATGFTGIYIALTGEANINIDPPGSLLPATIAHELAHQRGVTFEEEANFSAIAACVTSGIPAFEYSGYLLGLIYLENALYKADPEAFSEISSSLSENVRQDFKDDNDYWSKHHSQATKAAEVMYDGFLKSNGVVTGIKSYGECVDMLSLWGAKKAN